MGELLPLNGGTYYLWKYVPNLAASIIFIVVWLILSALVAWRMFKTKTWFCSAFLIGCLSKYYLDYTHPVIMIQLLTHRKWNS